MTDTLKRLAGPTVVTKSTGGTTLYTPGSGQAIARHAILRNRMPWDAYVDLGLNDLSVAANIQHGGILVPAFRTVDFPTDLIATFAGSDSIRARQSIAYKDIYNSASLLATPATVASGTGNAGAASTVATGSWTEVNGSLYILWVAWKKSSGAGTISSFTDTHTGISWTLIGQVTSADGQQKLAAYAAVSTGTTATTTTVNFSASQDASAVAVDVVTATGTFDNTTANGVDALPLFGGGEDPRNTTTPSIEMIGRNPANSLKLFGFTESGARAVTVPTGHTALDGVATNLTLKTSYQVGDDGNPSVRYAPTVTTGDATNLALGVEVLERAAPVAVTLYGVEVT